MIDFNSGISTHEAPEQAAQAAQSLIGATEEIAEVSVEVPPAGLVVLPGGFIDNSHTLFKECEVRELTGEDEEALAKAASSRNVTRVLNTILARGVVKVGPYAADEKLLKSLLIGDRDTLVLGVRIETYGEELDLEVECPYCQNNMEVVYNLRNDVKTREMEEPNKRIYRLPLKKGGHVDVSLPTGAVQTYLSNATVKTTAELNTILLSQCVEAINDEPLIGTGPVKRLGMADRKAILKFLDENQPGPQYNDVKQNCDSCEKEFPLPIDIGDLFRG